MCTTQIKVAVALRILKMILILRKKNFDRGHFIDRVLNGMA